MASFCANCGTGTGGGKFCPKCGAPQTTGPAASPDPSYQSPYPAPPVRRKSPVLKIVLIVVAVFLVLGTVVLVKGYYFLKDTYHEAKQQLNEKAGHAEETHAGCGILAKDSVSKILGVPVAAIKGNDAGEIREYCNYLSPANVAAASAADKEADDAEKARESPDHEPSLKDIQSIAKQIGNATKNRPLLKVQVFRGNGPIAIFGMKTASRLAGNGAANIPGPWDEAYFGPEDKSFAVRKGHSAIVIELSQVDDRRNAGLALAKEMVAGI